MEGLKENFLIISKKGDKKIFLWNDLVDKSVDQWERTPLHNMASNGHVEVLSHPSVDIVRDYSGLTPLDNLDWAAYPVELLKELGVRLPKEIEDKKLIYKKELISIFRTPNAIKFIEDICE